MIRALAVALLSAATLGYEILLVRVFAIAQFHHFAYMAIGVAMLGIGAAGTLLAMAPPRDDVAARWLPRTAGLTALALVLCPALAQRIPLDPTRLIWDAGQWLGLAVIYLLIALPFASGALAVLLALGLERARPGRLYGAGFLGSATGAALAVAALWIMAPARALAAPAPLAAAAGLLLARSPFGLLALAAGAGALASPPWRLAITPYKGLPQVEAYPAARRTAERTSPVGWIVGVRAPAFRFAPGLSLAYDGPFPPQTALFSDGDLTGVLSHWGEEPGSDAVLDWMPTALPYALGSRERVLVVGAGGGTEVWNATAHGAKAVVAVELSFDVAELARRAAPPPRGAGGRVEWVVADARSYLARTPHRFDLVTLGPGAGPGPSAAGVHALSEDFLQTVDAYRAYLSRLTPDGVLAVTGWLAAPPRGSVRTILTAGEALRHWSPASLERGLIVARSWGTATVLVKPAGFTLDEVTAIQAWARERRMDLDWTPGLERPAPEFNFLDRPELFRAARAATAGREDAAALAREHAFAVAPVDDARPYPHHFLRPASIGAFLRQARGNWFPFAEWGYVALAATLAQSVALAGLLLLGPAASRARRPPGLGRLLAYFGALGLGYLAAELAVIQVLGLALGHPVYAVAAALAGFLVGSGIGSIWSDRIGPERGPAVLAAIALLLLAQAVLLLNLAHLAQPAPWPVRLGVALLACLPAATLMGMPFPLGLRTLVAGERARLAWAWAANGFASVVAAPLAALLALELGSRVVLAAAGSAYLAAWLVYPRAGGSSGLVSGATWPSSGP